MSDRLLKAREVAELFGQDVATIVRRTRTGELPGFRLYGRAGGPLRYRESEIQRELDRWRTITADNASGPARLERRGRDTGGESDARSILRPVD